MQAEKPPSKQAQRDKHRDLFSKELMGTENDLINRLSNMELRHTKVAQPIIFLVGSALTMPEHGNKGGVPNVDGMVKLVQEHFKKNGIEQSAYKQSDDKRYQRAFRQLFYNFGPDGSRDVLSSAVLNAYEGNLDQFIPDEFKAGIEKKEDTFKLMSMAQKEYAFQLMEATLGNWLIPRGAQALGAIVSEFPSKFGRYILTTNFDPLLAISIRRARGQLFQSSLHGDGNPKQAIASGCHLVHLHGYWYRDALHSPELFKQDRPQLRKFLKDIVSSYTIVVLGYGGWDDQFTRVVEEIVGQYDAFPDILWCQYKGTPDQQIQQRLLPGLARGRVSFYKDIDCNQFLPNLLCKLRETQAPEISHIRTDNTDKDNDEVSRVLEGEWILLSSHGARYRIVLDKQGSESEQSGELKSAERLFDSDPIIRILDGEEAKKWKWEIENNVLKLRDEKTDYSLEIPTPLNGTIHWCREKLPSNNCTEDKIQKLTELWKDYWHEHWKANRQKDKRCMHHFADLILGDYLVSNNISHAERMDPLRPDLSTPAPVVYMAIHVVPWPSPVAKWKNEYIDEFSKQGVVEGHWIKFAEGGGTYLIKLRSSGDLIESPIFENTRRWSGRWWIGKTLQGGGENMEEYIHFWLKRWDLQIKIPSDIINETPNPIFKDCKEIEPGSTRATTFTVAHVCPP